MTSAPLWTFDELAMATGGTLTGVGEGASRAASGINFDSRALQPGDIFLALKGARDGHDFVAQAFQSGAAIAVTRRPIEGGPCLLVPDVQTALEDMADLFRVLMADNRELVPLANEIALSRQYLALEKLRLDERLIITWAIDDMPPDALIPPLVLQPLLENAVYHGIEPMPNGGEIVVNIYTGRREVHIVLSNPFPSQGGHHSGNKMALTNIRERLALHFDAEAMLTSRVTGKGAARSYEVHIVIPYQSHTRKQEPA